MRGYKKIIYYGGMVEIKLIFYFLRTYLGWVNRFVGRFWIRYSRVKGVYFFWRSLDLGVID